MTGDGNDDRSEDEGDNNADNVANDDMAVHTNCTDSADTDTVDRADNDSVADDSCSAVKRIQQTDSVTQSDCDI